MPFADLDDDARADHGAGVGHDADRNPFTVTYRRPDDTEPGPGPVLPPVAARGRATFVTKNEALRTAAGVPAIDGLRLRQELDELFGHHEPERPGQPSTRD